MPSLLFKKISPVQEELKSPKIKPSMTKLVQRYSYKTSKVPLIRAVALLGPTFQDSQ